MNLRVIDEFDLLWIVDHARAMIPSLFFFVYLVWPSYDTFFFSPKEKTKQRRHKATQLIFQTTNKKMFRFDSYSITIAFIFMIFSSKNSTQHDSHKQNLKKHTHTHTKYFQISYGFILFYISSLLCCTANQSSYWIKHIQAIIFWICDCKPMYETCASFCGLHFFFVKCLFHARNCIHKHKITFNMYKWFECESILLILTKSILFWLCHFNFINLYLFFFQYVCERSLCAYFSPKMKWAWFFFVQRKREKASAKYSVIATRWNE